MKKSDECQFGDAVGGNIEFANMGIADCAFDCFMIIANVVFLWAFYEIIVKLTTW